MSRLVAGIDGGGTGTRAWIATEDGSVLGFGEGGASNVFALGADVSSRALSSCLEMALADAGCDSSPAQIACVHAGVAGAGPADLSQALADAFSRVTGIERERCHVGDDLSIALAGALEGAPGLVLLAGTGSAAFGRSADRRSWRSGGWGSALDDPGSGYWLGFEALRAVVRAADGRMEHTPLIETVKKAVGVSTPREILVAMGGRSLERSVVAGLAPAVLSAIEFGDRVALDIARRGAAELALLAGAVVRALDLEEAEFACVGGLLQRGAYREIVLEAVAETLPRLRPVAARVEPAGGAVGLAIERLGVPLDATIWRCIRETSRMRQSS